jgi:hypothetical protein
VLVYGIHNTNESQEKTMLHRLNDTCILKKSDCGEILLILAKNGYADLANAVNNAGWESWDGWVAVPYEASKKQLRGNTNHPISLGRWQSILALSPENPPTESI